MQVEITIKNYRCFSDSKPARIVLRKGFTAFVGVNNSGKSSLLKFFYEFRNLFQYLSYPDNNFIETLKGNSQEFTLPSSIFDPEEVFCNANSRDIEIQLKLLPSDETTQRQYVLTGLKQISSPNKAQASFVS